MHINTLIPTIEKSLQIVEYIIIPKNHMIALKIHRTR